MWKTIQPGNVLLIECPSRWYLGEVDERCSLTFTLKPGLGRAACVHYISDLGKFLAGELPPDMEITPLVGQIEINLASVESVHNYPREALEKVCQRTH